MSQGPSNYEEEDTDEVLQHNNKLFMARKFNVNLDDKARLKIRKSVVEGAYNERLRKEGLTDNIVRYRIQASVYWPLSRKAKTMGTTTIYSLLVIKV